MHTAIQEHSSFNDVLSMYVESIRIAKTKDFILKFDIYNTSSGYKVVLGYERRCKDK